MAIDVLRQAQGNNLSDTLSTSIGSTDTTIPVNTISIWSANGGKVIIDRGLSTQEIVYCSGVSGSSLVVQAGGRGLEGTTAQGHNVGAAVESVPTAKDWNDLVISVENVLVKSTGLLDTTKVATPSAVSDFATNFANFIKSGLTAPTSASLSTTITAGTIFYAGVEISIASDGGHTYTASNDCYVDVSNAGAYTYNTVANGAAAPALTASSIRIAKVVTSGTAVTSVLQDGSLDSLGNVIYPSKPAATLNGTETLRNKRRIRRLVVVTQAAIPTINTDNTDIAKITGLAQAITSFSTNLTGTPVDGDLLEIRVTDNGTARALTFGASFEATTVALPTTTVISTELKILFEWNATASKWDCVAVA